MKAFFALATVLSALSLASASTCAAYTSLANLDVSEIDTKWYLIASSDVGVSKLSCAWISERPGTGIFSYVINGVTQNPQIKVSIAADKSVTLTYNNILIGTNTYASGTTTLKVVATDYNNYASVYACTSIVSPPGSTSTNYFEAELIFGRARTLCSSYATAKAAFASGTSFSAVTQTGCSN